MGRKKAGDRSAIKGEIFAFRVTPQQKHELHLAVEKAHYQANARRRPGEAARDKADLIAEALAKGLKALG